MSTSSFQTLIYIKIEEIFYFFLKQNNMIIKKRAKIICENIMCKSINIITEIHIQSIKDL